MARPQNPATIWIHYLLLRLIAGVLTLLPLRVAVVCGRMLGWTLYTVDTRHRLRCTEAISRSLGINEAEADRITRGMYDHLGTMVAEFPRLPQINHNNLAKFMEWNGGDSLMADLIAEGKGLVLFSGHIGNWEVTGHSISLIGCSSGSIARPLDNPLIHNWVTRIRTSGPQQIWQKKGAMLNALRTLRDGKAFGILNDQNGGNDGEFVPFFGQEASTVHAAVDLAIRTGAPILCVGTHRLQPMKFRFICRAPIRPDPSATDLVCERRRLLTLCNQELEAIIRTAPEQWLWLHARWKTKNPRSVEGGIRALEGMVTRNESLLPQVATEGIP